MTLSPELRSAAAELVAADRILVATDFDGVLAPLVQDPTTSRPLPGTIDALLALAALPRTYAAVVSGRDLDTLTELTGLGASEVTRIGSHGAESSAATTSGGVTKEHRTRLDALVEVLGPVTAAHPGSGLELKPTAVVLHTRGMAPDAARAAEREALEVVSQHDGVHVLHGKHVVESSVVKADKGTALLGLRDTVGATAVAYLGDDVTDEHAFTALGDDDLTVKVGPGETAARYRVDSPQDAAELLVLLATLRAG